MKSDFLRCLLSSEFLQDMDLLAENRSLIHTGKFLRQPDTGFEWSGWSELFVLLFDNYRKSWGREKLQWYGGAVF
jgi:hypothetical protein